MQHCTSFCITYSQREFSPLFLVAQHYVHITSALNHIKSFFPLIVSKPAPHWEGTAVINGEFKELKLSDYKGKYLVFFFYPLDL